jgi:hypothetical protein
MEERGRRGRERRGRGNLSGLNYVDFLFLFSGKVFLCYFDFEK